MERVDLKAWKAEQIRRGKCLVEAAGSGQHDELLRLLKLGVSVDAVEYNKSLFYASENYSTPVYVACEKNHLDCVNTLIAYGANVNASDRFDVAPIHICSQNGYYECLKALIDAGADCSVPTKYSKKGNYHYTVLPYLGGTTPLHLAASGDHISCVKELIHSGADYNAIDEKGRTSLYIAAQLKLEECVLTHLRNAIGRDILSLPGFETGDTPLHFTVRNGMVESVEALLKLGSDPNHLNHAGMSPLHYAVTYNPETKAHSEEILRLLVLYGYNTDVNLRDGSGYTPLHYVSFNVGTYFVRRPKLAHFLLAYGANPNIFNQRSFNILDNEIKVPFKDQLILNTVARSVLHLPKLNRSKLFAPANHVSRVMMPYQRMRLEDIMNDRERHLLDVQDPKPSKHCTLREKLQWYRNLTSKPRSLQHCCRFTIRKALGQHSLRRINELPVPDRLHEYLLLAWDDDVEI